MSKQQENESRNSRYRQIYSPKAKTQIWSEEATEENPYIAKTCRIHGYDLMELMRKRSFSDVLYLLFMGKLPSADETHILETLMIALISPGTRHSSTRASMYAGVSKTGHGNILPIGLMILSGSYLGSEEVEQSILFFQKYTEKEPNQLSEKLIQQRKPNEGDWHIVPGFGSRFGGIDQIPQEVAHYLLQLPGAGKTLKWGSQFAHSLSPYNMGWLSTGVAAAVFADLGIGAREGGGLFQLMSAPGLLAHGLEQTHKPITAMPLIHDRDYVIENEEK